MNLFSRFINVVKSNINDLISQAEDPKKMLEQIIQDIEIQLGKARKEVAVAIADEKNLQRQYLKHQELSQLWEKRAMIALKNNQEELAMSAVKEQESYEQGSKEYEQQWIIQKTSTDKLRISLGELNKKLQEARRKKNLLIARQKRAEAQNKIAKTMSSLSDSSAFDSFARMEEKIEHLESQSDANVELQQELSGNKLEDDIQALEQKHRIQSKLDKLKAKMNKSS